MEKKIQLKMSVSDIMAMNRQERRRLAKINGIKKIPGSNKPYVKTESTRKSTRTHN